MTPDVSILLKSQNLVESFLRHYYKTLVYLCVYTIWSIFHSFSLYLTRSSEISDIQYISSLRSKCCATVFSRALINDPPSLMFLNKKGLTVYYYRLSKPIAIWPTLTKSERLLRRDEPPKVSKSSLISSFPEFSNNKRTTRHSRNSRSNSQRAQGNPNPAVVTTPRVSSLRSSPGTRWSIIKASSSLWQSR